MLGSLDKITQVLKVTAFVASDPSFTGQPGVANGASMFLGKVFGDMGIHVRSAVGVSVLPLDAPVEIEFVFEVSGVDGWAEPGTGSEEAAESQKWLSF